VARFLRDLCGPKSAAETRHRFPGWLLTRDPKRSTPDRRGWQTMRGESAEQRPGMKQSKVMPSWANRGEALVPITAR